MRIFNFAREALLVNQGCNFFWQTDTKLIVRGVSASVSLGFTTVPPASGSLFAEAFVNLWVTAPMQPPQFSPDQWRYYQGPPPSDWGSDFVNVQQDVAAGISEFGQGLPVPGGLMTCILKASAPKPANQFLSSRMNVCVEPGSYFVLHMDAQSIAGFPCDVEVGLTIETELR